MKNILFAFVLLVAFPLTVLAKDISAADPEAIAKVGEAYGKAEVGIDSEGDPKISGTIDDTKYTIFFYGCDDKGKGCTSLQFTAGWSGRKVTMQDMNSWNRDQRFVKAYIDTEGDPILEMDVTIKTPIPVSGMEEWFKTWERGLGRFEREVLSGR